MLVDQTGQVVRGPLPQLQEQRLPIERILEETQHPRLFGQPLIEVKGLGAFLTAAAPLGADGSSTLYLVLIRDLPYITGLARPMSVLFTLIITLMLALALVVSGWLSRNLVERLASTGAAARALAEGDLTQRAPVKGQDEITDVAGHFNHMAERIETLVDGLRKSEGLRKELLVTVSHELRTPMTSIAGFAEALRDGLVREEPQRQRYYAILANEAARLIRLINDVFDVAKLEAGQLEIRLQELPVAEWLVEAAESFSPTAETAGAHLELVLPPEAERARVYGDRDRLDQVLGNLLSNAFRFTPAGAPVQIRARVDQEDLVVEVADQGPGIESAEADRVFDRFYQGANRGKGSTGAGLGLAIVKSLVEAHGGRVGVETAPGQGATFWFRLKRLEG